MIVSILLINIFLIFFLSKKQRFTEAASYFFLFFLVTAQTFYIEGRLGNVNSINYLYSFISRFSFQDSLIYLLATLMFGVLFSFFPSFFINKDKHKREMIVEITNAHYASVFLFVSFSFMVLVVVVVGVADFFTQARPGIIPGATIFICMLSVGIWPLLYKLAFNRQILKIDIALFIYVLILSSFVSRIQVLLYIAMCFFVWFYGGAYYLKKVRLVFLLKLFLFTTMIVFLFIIVGAVRDALSFVTPEEIIPFLLNNTSESMLALDKMYEIGIEGMTGLSGAFTQYEYLKGDVCSFYGADIPFKGIYLATPAVIKDVVYPLVESFYQCDWYTSSVVSTGVEQSYTSWGWYGCFIFPLLIKVYGDLVDYLGRGGGHQIVFASLLGGMSIFLVRGSWPVFVSFGIAYTVVFLLMRSLLFKKFKIC